MRRIAMAVVMCVLMAGPVWGWDDGGYKAEQQRQEMDRQQGEINRMKNDQRNMQDDMERQRQEMEHQKDEADRLKMEMQSGFNRYGN